MTSTSAQTKLGEYVYCIIRCPEQREFTTRGIGERGDVVHTVCYEDLAAVVSASPTTEYESSRRNMMAHTVVLEEVMREYSMLPARFDTVAPNSGALVEQVLKRRYGELNGLLHDIEGRVELGLKAFWYEEVIFQEVLHENEAIRRLRDSLMGRRPEQTYYERIRLGELIESAMWKKRDEDAATILGPLTPLAREYRTNKVITDRMVINAAFLVDGNRQPEFDAAVTKLDEDMGKRLTFKYVGSVPPYNFVNIVVKWDE